MEIKIYKVSKVLWLKTYRIKSKAESFIRVNTRELNGVPVTKYLSYIYLANGLCVRRSSHWGGSPQNELRDEWTCGVTLASAYVLCRLSATWLQLQMMGRSLRWKWVLIGVLLFEHQRLSSMREFIFVDYQTSELQCNY